jgi:hypothetical protein
MREDISSRYSNLSTFFPKMAFQRIKSGLAPEPAALVPESVEKKYLKFIFFMNSTTLELFLFICCQMIE